MQSLAGEDPINYTAAEFRTLIGAVWPTDGIVGPTSFHVTQAPTVGWSIHIGGGIAKVGGYLVSMAEGITLSLAADIQTQVIAVQHHGVFLVVQDKTVYGDGYYAEIVVATDGGAGYSAPDGAAILLLGVVAVSPGQTNIQNQHISARPANAAHGLLYKLADVAFNSTVASAHLTADTGEARARYAAGNVRLTGGIKRANGASFATGDTTLGTLPWYLTPNTPRRVIGIASGGVPWWLSVGGFTSGAAAGVISANIPSSTAATLFLDGMNYEID
jgi:hypothetical protein